MVSGALYEGSIFERSMSLVYKSSKKRMYLQQITANVAALRRRTHIVSTVQSAAGSVAL
jgi:hypothetical protein